MVAPEVPAGTVVVVFVLVWVAGGVVTFTLGAAAGVWSITVVELGLAGVTTVSGVLS